MHFAKNLIFKKLRMIVKYVILYIHNNKKKTIYTLLKFKFSFFQFISYFSNKKTQ